MEKSPLAQKIKSVEVVVEKVFNDDFESFAQGNPDAFRGRSIEIERSNMGRRLVFFTETTDSVTAEYVGFYEGYSRIIGALKLMKNSFPARMWRPSGHDQYRGMLFALGEIQGEEATPGQIADFTPIREALEYLERDS